ncbi:hypothetical protein A3709_12105 [Halioglobus sp. HI00S01]|nr:hypothetical protein A3709_12105 [Halioglobus sp. HI00S01]
MSWFEDIEDIHGESAGHEFIQPVVEFMGPVGNVPPLDDAPFAAALFQFIDIATADQVAGQEACDSVSSLSRMRQ